MTGNTIDYIAARKRRARSVVNVLCGSCKATGLIHVWTTDGELEPAVPARCCPICDGTGRYIGRGHDVMVAR